MTPKPERRSGGRNRPLKQRMADVKAGVVVVTKFCRPQNDKFKKYVDYIDREEAVRAEHEDEFDLFTDYMGNPEKTTGLFTASHDQLGKSGKKKLKESFQKAQENQSLMWQTVISFDNTWLKENGILRHDGSADEQALKNIARHAIGKMLKCEGLENAVWAAAIHYNTDNLHIHVATVEPEPMRETKEYNQYRKVERDGKWVKEPILDPAGNTVKRKEYVGRFRRTSIEACKRSVVNEILKEQENNRVINQIIREKLVRHKQDHPFLKDQQLQRLFLEIYQKMPDVERSLWNYNNPVMKPLRSMIDHLSRTYIELYQKDEFQELDRLLRQQAGKYERAYGKAYLTRDYRETKLQDLYTRMGNSVLKELRRFDQNGGLQGNIGYMDDNISSPGRNEVQRKNYQLKRNRRYLLGSALRSLKRSLARDLQKERNEREHEQLLAKSDKDI